MVLVAVAAVAAADEEEEVEEEEEEEEIPIAPETMERLLMIVGVEHCWFTITCKKLYREISFPACDPV